MSTDTCRICLGKNFLLDIFGVQNAAKLSVTIMSLANVTITPDDGLPQRICNLCVSKLNDCVGFINLCEDSDKKLRLMLEKCSDNEDSQTGLDSEMEFYCKLFTEADPSMFMIINDTIESKTDDEDTKIAKKKERQQCSTCGKVMSSRFRLKTHLRTHTGERPYSCPHCSKNFSLAQNLKVHLRTHTGEKPLQCTVCGESFAHSAGLATHKRKHTGQTPYQCVLCPRSFRTMGHLQYHVRRHTGEKNFECDSCGKAFITRSDLKQHFLTHTGDKPHVCPVCGVRLTRSTHLKRHILTTHGTQFSCKICPLKFTREIEYEKHRKTHYAEKT